MNSCRGHEFTPVFGGTGLSDHEESSEEEQKAGSDSESGESELEPQDDIRGAFADAKDRWKVDAETLKGFYLHSPTGQLFGWDQAKGVLYEYNHGSSECTAIWAACTPEVNAEVWTALPLPPTDPASLQQPSVMKSGDVLCVLHLSRAETPRRACEFFCERLGLDGGALRSLLALPAPGQAYVLKTFCAPERDPSGSLRRQVQKLQAMSVPPWAGTLESSVLRVAASGAILGRCVPEVEALCWFHEDQVAAAHCRIACLDGAFAVCDLGSDEAGTLFDGRRLGDVWAPLQDGCRLDMGPIRVKVELTPVNAAPTAERKRKLPQRGGWRDAKRPLLGSSAGQQECQQQVAEDPMVRDISPTPQSAQWQAPISTQNLSPVAERMPLGGVKATQAFAGSERPSAASSVVRARRPFWAAPQEDSDESPDSPEPLLTPEPDWIPRTP